MNQKKLQLSSLNELRGLAALYVLFSHVPAAGILGRELGNFGVGIFYLLSAFLTLYNAKPGIVIFLKKRAVRILPLYWFMTLLTFVVCKFKPDWFHTTEATLPNLIKSIFFIPYTTVTSDSIIVRPILTVGWTLFLEIVFYLVFALAMKLSYKYRNLITLSIMVIFYFILSFTPETWAITAYRDWMPYFVIGILTAMAWPGIENILTKGSSVLKKENIPVVVSAIIKTIIVMAAAKFFGHFEYVIVPVIVFFIFIALSFFTKPSKSLTFLGAISYELYLIHEYIVKGFSRLVMPLDEKSLKTAIVIVVLVAVAIGLAALIHKILSVIFHQPGNQVREFQGQNEHR